MQPAVTEEGKASVQSYWEGRPCGSKHARSGEGTPEYFAEVERRRYELEPFIARYADFAGARGQSVLEIGTGLGTDLVQFARSGARVSGIDLTDRAVALVRRRLELEGLPGDVRVADAENLPFPDGAFDRVYSWGVLHHTPHTGRAVAEAIRVARPGGRLCVMLYNRRSWVAWGLWLRHALAAGRPGRSVADVLRHHMESAGTKAYTCPELQGLFAGLDDLSIESVATPYDRRVGGPLVRLTGSRLGWFWVVRGRVRPRADAS